jgi:chromosomal replication initiation ATPase DnaA
MDQEAAVGDATRGWLLPEKSLMAMVDPSGKPVAIPSTFDTFVAGPSNQLAFAASQAAASSDPPRYNPVFLSRSNGLGGGAP